jgi:hypothetical protein
MPKRHNVLALLCYLSILAVVIARAASLNPSIQVVGLSVREIGR